MKKTLLLLIPTLLLMGCTNKTTKEINIICPVGAPAFAFYNYAENDKFETNGSPDNITTMMTKASQKTVVVIDTVSGVQAINKGAPYKLAASITFGNFYLCATGKDDNGQMDPGDKIVLFGQNKTPDLLFHYLYGNDYDSGIEYVTAAGNAKGVLEEGKNLITGNDIDYVFLAQPAVFAALKTNTNASIYANLQEVYKQKSDNKQMVQASVFIKNTLEKEVADEFLASLESDINAVIETPELITQKLGSLDENEVMSTFGTKAQVAMAVTKQGNALGLGFKKAKENKQNIDNFLSLFGEKETNEKIYY